MPVSAIMARFVQAVVDAARATGGLVDATMLDAIEQLGYRTERFRGSLALPLALALAPPRRPAARASGSPLAHDRGRPRHVHGHAPAGRQARRRRHRQGPARRRRRRDAAGAPQLPRRLRRRSARRRQRRPPALRRGGGTAQPAGPARVQARRRRGRDDVHHEAQLDGATQAGAPPARSRDRASGLHRHRPGLRPGADGARGRGAGEGGAAERAAGRRGLAAPRRHDCSTTTPTSSSSLARRAARTAAERCSARRARTGSRRRRAGLPRACSR